MADEEVPVLIVGGSLVGLTTAMLLGHHGVPSLAVERHAGTAIHPRAGHFQLRTMELLRQLGLEERVRAKSLETYSATGGIIAVESLAGRQLATYVAELNPRASRASARRCACSSTRTRSSRSCASVRSSSARPSAIARRRSPSSRTTTASPSRCATSTAARRAGCGRATSWRRTATAARCARLGIGMRGHRELSRSITIYFRADCGDLLRDRNQGVLYVHNPELRGFFRLDRSGGTGFLVINTVGADVTQDSAVDVQAGLTRERALDYLRTAIGADVPMEIVDIAPWQAEAICAERLQAGRVFLAGDAAHAVPPNGGFGGNAGVQDAHNLAWKLAAVVRGEAGPGLLGTYEAERLPLCELTVRQAYTRYATRVVPERGTDGVDPPVPDIELEIGLVARSAAIASEDASDGGVLHLPASELDGRPGTRAPHMWLADGRSTLDLFGSELVVLRPDGDGWAPPGARTHVVDADGFGELYGLSPGGASLVRPDGVVAWRARDGAGRDDLVRAVATALQSARP